ncbi:DUF3301 domain-containing protein [Facilibium subflavum]|uniref:DUF3301 domain-containing protein n=1 Tax=Facilibium subflavum TaxID=2219058 RepID=UPI0013C3641F|nr:DUF3301 domain-containing protein [Facilibium subflavum]
MSLSIALVIIIVLIIIILTWKNMMHAREIAIARAVKICKQWDVLLLDDTVCLTKIKLIRSHGAVGAVCFFREYSFDYTINGADRFKAVLQFTGKCFNRVISDDSAVSPLDANHVTGRKSHNNVIELNHFRQSKDDKNKDD